ncbi:related to proteinase inhibitor PBI2 [Cephalotrichum gorgonifer]|uniref:Related to proteinase inhibitor PBI2 n=1 Tax=Cephalotrichum gorgonifer TaxID=2041049 RepID=A0AAE8SYL0_9PEZI|nr:related to proteinase inhibitor PBI2 [Cephalotrichum gorgonifer]
MPTYIVSLKDDATPDQIKEAKDLAVSQGGTIGHEYSLIKAFSVTYPEGSVNTLDSNEHVKAVELDGKVTTQ